MTSKAAPAAAAWDALLERGHQDGRLVAQGHEGRRPARAAALPPELAPALAGALLRTGVEGLFSHQQAAWRAARGGHVIVTTGTASGKSLCFNLPVLDAIAADPLTRALYLYPTKALAQDQARKLSELRLPGLRHAIYDGDTPQPERAAIRRSSNLVLTNPDMLHVGLLPHHRRWGDFLHSLAFVVVDEAHVYRGVFGSHVANVLRRLRRMARHYGAAPRFLLASATIANPAELAERLTGLEMELVDQDGAPRAERRIAMWNPPVVEPVAQARRSSLSEAADLLAELVRAGSRTICFIRSRRGVELVQRFAELRLAESGHGDLAGRIAPYRAGYTPAQRREIERRLAGGELLAVVATDALELGIDIGHLDAAIVAGFPGTVASLRQMWGRAGRRERGLALYVAGQDALDQFFCRHPDEFLERPVEAAILDHESEAIYLQQLVAAAYEAPLEAADGDELGPRWQAGADRLVTAGELRERGGRYFTRSSDFVASRISLRSASAERFAIFEDAGGELIGTVEAERAFSAVHPGAVYLHLGSSYEVRELDTEQRRAVVHRFDGDFYTQPKRETDTYVEQVREMREALGAQLSFGIVSVSEQVIGFQRRRIADQQAVDFVALDLPEQSFVTQALWYTLPEEIVGGLPLEALLGALHATEHSQIAVLPLLAMCDRWDIGGLSTNVHFQTGRPTIFIYDGHPGGVGIARQGFREFETLVGDARRLIAECPCEHGCPSCVQSPKCGNLNEPLSKAGALEVMARMQSAGRAARAA